MTEQGEDADSQSIGTEQGEDADSQSIGGLFAQFADDATGLVRAEVELYRATAFHRIDRAKPAFGAVIAAILMVQAAVVCLLVMIAVALTPAIGALGSGLLVTIIAIGIAAAVGNWGLKRLAALAEEDTP